MTHLLGSLALVVLASTSPPPAPCASPSHRQLDFWLGTWEVRTPNGKVAGTNRITSILGGCAVLEQWTGASGFQGTSLNSYAEGGWHQTWVDGGGTLLSLHGGFRDGAMRLAGTTSGAGGSITRHELSLTPSPGGTVRQLWRSSADGGATWTVVFDGTYARQPSP
jgi:hypothetical protein